MLKIQLGGRSGRLVSVARLVFFLCVSDPKLEEFLKLKGLYDYMRPYCILVHQSGNLGFLIYSNAKNIPGDLHR